MHNEPMHREDIHREEYHRGRNTLEVGTLQAMTGLELPPYDMSVGGACNSMTAGVRAATKLIIVMRASQ